MSRAERVVNQSLMRAIWAVVLAGCGVQYTNPVYISKMGLDLTTHNEPPVIMLVLDKSGSMDSPIGDGGTRLTQVKSWAADSIPSIASSARLGLQIFPADNACSPSGAAQLLSAPPASPQAPTDLLAQLTAVTASGGTPTGQSLAFTALAMPSDSAEHIALLLTDGVPNCNPNNANTCADAAACQCTITDTGGTPACGAGANDSQFCVRGCLDEDATNATIASLPLQTIVIAFGSDFAGAAKDVADQMAAVGGKGEHCAADSDCTSGACLTSVGACKATPFAAANAAELGAVTTALGQKIFRSSRCRFILDTPSTLAHVRVYFGETQVSASEVVRESSTVVHVLGDSCQRLLSTPSLTASLYDAEDP